VNILRYTEEYSRFLGMILFVCNIAGLFSYLLHSIGLNYVFDLLFSIKNNIDSINRRQYRTENTVRNDEIFWPFSQSIILCLLKICMYINAFQKRCTLFTIIFKIIIVSLVNFILIRTDIFK